ncbi:MAG: adenylate/guanylate cyclase domain-containing protein [Candidatus Binatia bacterium]
MDQAKRTNEAAAGEVALIFTDVEGFTEMVDRLGDAEVYLLMRRYHGIVAEALARHGGTELERQGDGSLLAFADAPAALRCAIEIQRELAVHSARFPERPLRVRMGLHVGTPLRDRGQYFGRVLIVGARIMALATGGEILASTSVRERTATSGEFHFGPNREVALKGLRQHHGVARVSWRHPLLEPAFSIVTRAYAA